MPTINDILHTSPLPVTNTDTGTASMQIQGNVLDGLADTGNPVKVGAVYTATLPTYADGQRTELQSGTRGSLSVQLVAPNSPTNISVTTANADALSSAFVAYVMLAYQYRYNGTSWDRETKSNLVSRIVSSAATTNATSAKASAGTVTNISAFSTVAGAKFLKLYNKATAPTVGTDTPIATIALPANTQTMVHFPAGLYFSTGIAYAITGAVADADTTALAAGDIVALNVVYS